MDNSDMYNEENETEEVMGEKNCGDYGWWDDRSLPVKILMVIGIIILGGGLLFLFGFIVMLLWNWLMPEIFGLKPITYWQAWGLLALCWILFKNFNTGSSESKSDRKRKKALRRHMESENAG